MRNLLRTSIALPGFVSGYGQFLRTGDTPEYGYRRMRQLYFATNGRSHDLISWLQSRVHKKHVIENPMGILGTTSSSDVQSLVHEIAAEGYKLFEGKLEAKTCDELTEFALSTPCIPRTPEFSGKKTLYDRNNLVASIYDFDTQTLLENKTIQKLATDLSLFSVAQKYLGMRPILQNISMWWSTAEFKGQKDISKDAQLYHTDLDTIKWINFFFYLSDVTELNGPHCFVARSHKRKPAQVQRDGRISDEEVSQFYPKSDILEFRAKRGTIIAADTKGLHKGKELLQGERLMLQLRFATTMFGQKYETARVNEKFSEDFKQAVKKYESSYLSILGLA